MDPACPATRVVTAAALFDGHDAAIHVMRRVLQSQGAEVIHLGHDRSVQDVVDAVIQEDAQAVAVSSYQGGHVEYFRYLRDLLRDRGAGHVRIFGGGGGVIVPQEIEALHAYGIERIYSPEDGRQLGLVGMINDLLSRCGADPAPAEAGEGGLLLLRDGRFHAAIDAEHPLQLARIITLVERGSALPSAVRLGLEAWKLGRAAQLTEGGRFPAPVLGITGTGGAGKSSLVDELLVRFLRDHETARVAVLSVDPSKRRTGGALLGDRIRMNALRNPRTFMRSLATRGSGREVSDATAEAVGVLTLAGYDLVILETSGIGQGDSAVVDLCDVSAYVMTPEYGAASQLEKIDMIDFADLIAVNKFESRGGEDALRDVRKQFRRGRDLWGSEPKDEELPVYGTIASRFNDLGVTAFYRGIVDRLPTLGPSQIPDPGIRASPRHEALIPPARQRYLADVSDSCRSYRRGAETQAEFARREEALRISAAEFTDEGIRGLLFRQADQIGAQMDPAARILLAGWPEARARLEAPEFVFKVRGREVCQETYVESLAGLQIPKVAVPRLIGAADIMRFLLLEALPGSFPYTAGLYPFRRAAEAPKRQFAGEGPPIRTNERFHLLCRGDDAKRLSTAFDSVTLYGQDPDPRPDIWGKIGESGVSICCLDDMKILYGGFDLCEPSTSVSMTINGPAPMILAMYLNTAIDQRVEGWTQAHGRAPTEAEHQGIAAETVSIVRGTVQADILKEDQAQNTCIFSTEFALRMMGDIQQWFIDHKVRNYYSVSISGYHIAEAGANPISQLAFTLANGFTLVECYLARGMLIDDFAPNLSFFFSNGLDPEYTVIGRVARRIWSVAMRDRYGAGPRSQMLKYHIQTSGRSLHAQEIQFNDIRTTLQALLAWHDNCNSLHTNAYDEAITTPTGESVRRAMAIQLIIQKELGIAANENPNQGSFIALELTDLVEAAVLAEFDRIAERGGVLGAMERQYQRSKIQDESLLYERRKHDGSLPLVGINTFLDPDGPKMASEDGKMEIRRASAEEKDGQIAQLRRFQAAHADESGPALTRLAAVALSGGNLFDELMATVRVASLGQISEALFEVGGRYRRNL